MFNCGLGQHLPAVQLVLLQTYLLFQQTWSANCWFFSVFLLSGSRWWICTVPRTTRKKNKTPPTQWITLAPTRIWWKKLKGPLQQGSGGALRVTSVLFFLFSKVWQLVGNRCFYFFWWCMRDVLDVNIWNLQPYLTYLLIFGRCNGLLGKGCIMFMFGNFCIEL